MTHMQGLRLVASALTLVIGLAVIGVAPVNVDAQQPAANQASGGLITGTVARCVNGAEAPAAGVAIGFEGGSASLARTDSSGTFFIVLPVGEYTITATASDGVATRSHVPVDAGAVLDIGILDIGAVTGCGSDAILPAPVAPTPAATPTIPAAPTPPAPTATPAPVPTAPPPPPADATPAGG